MLRYCHPAKVAADVLLSGGVIAYPTEGVYGLGCDPFNADAVGRILKVKVRPLAKGLILIADRLERLLPLLANLSTRELSMLQQSRPRPTTWVVPHNGRLPAWITGDRDAVAVRITAHPLAKALCHFSGMPIVSTSANRSGKRALVSSIQVRHHFGHELDGVLSGNVQRPGQSSQIIDLVSGKPLRS